MDVASHSLSAWLPRPPKAWLPRLPRPPKVLDLLKASVGVREGQQGVRNLQGFPLPQTERVAQEHLSLGRCHLYQSERLWDLLPIHSQSL